jgi:hypothetical protein
MNRLIDFAHLAVILAVGVAIWTFRLDGGRA